MVYLSLIVKSVIIICALLEAGVCQYLPTAFASDGDACVAPFVTDCIALRVQLRDADYSNTTIEIKDDQFTPIYTYGDCALAATWVQNSDQGSLQPTYKDASDAADAMMAYGYQDSILSGVLGRTDLPSGTQPLFWMLSGSYSDNNDWSDGLLDCLNAVVNNMTEEPVTVEDTPVPVPSNTVVQARSQTRSYPPAFGHSLVRRAGIQPPRQPVPSPEPTCTQIGQKYGISNQIFRCNCEGRAYNIHCFRTSNPDWTENDRQDALADLFIDVNDAWFRNEIQPGARILSDPKGAAMFAGATGNKDSWRVPNDSGNRCCNYLLAIQCLPMFGMTSIDGMCEPSDTLDYMYAFNENFKNGIPPGGSGGGTTIGKLTGGL